MHHRLCLCLLIGCDLLTAVRADDWVSESARYIDHAVMRDYERQADRESWQQERIAPPFMPLAADDANFLRRASVDLAGRLPRAEEVRRFVSDPSTDKRARLADALLKEPGAAEVRFRMFAEAFRVTDRVAGESQAAFIAWLRQAAAEDMPYDQMVKAMIMAENGTPASGLLKRDNDDALRTACSLADALLGEHLYCAMCHDHPFSEHTQMQCYQLAACFGRVTLQANYKYKDGHPGDEVQARPLAVWGDFATSALRGPVLSREARAQLAEAFAGSGTKRLPQIAALRVWRALFGAPGSGSLADHTTGGVETRPAWSELMPHDFEKSGTSCFDSPYRPTWMNNDFDDSNYAEGVHAMGEVLARCGFKLGEFQRVLAHTAAYGREACQPGSPGARPYLPLAPLVRRLPAEVIWDALVSRLPASQNEWRSSAQSLQVPEASHPLRLLGRARREWPDESQTPVSFELTRFMMNSTLVDQVVNTPPAGAPPLDDLVLSLLGRLPTEREKAAMVKHAGESPASSAQDLAWALLNTSEFLFER